VVHEQFADVLAGGARRRVVEHIMGQRDRAVAKAAGELVDLWVAFPGVDALGPIDVDEHIDEANELG
jgi:hypothetical protein